MRLLCYLRVNYVVLDLLLCDGDVLQNDLQPHCHHAGHPVDQTGANVTGHPPLEQENKTLALQAQQLFLLYFVFLATSSLWIVQTFSRFCFVFLSLM